MFLREKVLQPSVLHLQLSYAGFESGVSFRSFTNSPFQGLLALLLLHAETSTGGRVPASPVLFGCKTDIFLLVEGRSDTVAGNRSAVLGIPDLAAWGRDG